jgi:hypothetical protein
VKEISKTLTEGSAPSTINYRKKPNNFIPKGRHMKLRPLFALVFVLTLVLSACAPAAQPTQAPTTAPTTQVDVPTPTLEVIPSAQGTISGRVLNPMTEGVQTMLVVAFDALDHKSGIHYTTIMQAGQETYSLSVPAGEYIVAVYILDGNGKFTGPSGSYSNAVPCGMSASCTDDFPIRVKVTAGDTLTDINPEDFTLAASDNIPPMPDDVPGTTPPVKPTASASLVSIPDCSALRDSIAAALPFRWTMIDEPYTDHFTGAAGMVCHIEADGTGADFGSLGIMGVVEKLEPALAGWTYDPMRQADGPTGTVRSYTRGTQLSEMTVKWEPSADANCPSDQPITSCVLTAEQVLYTLIIRAWDVK